MGGRGGVSRAAWAPIGEAGVAYATNATSALWVGVAGVAYGALSIVGKNRNRRM